MFTTYPTYPRYRVLRRVDPMLKGEDVYALQNALNNVVGESLATDGKLGDKTAASIWHAQKKLMIVSDGKAGQITQRELALAILDSVPGGRSLPDGLGYGQMGHESSWLLGNYSSLRSNGTYDAGVVERNTEFTKPNLGFDPVDSIGAYVTNTLKYYQRFVDVTEFRGTDKSDTRRWKLAAGSWNAYAYANYFAGLGDSRTPTTEEAATFEAYMKDVTVYMEGTT